MYHTLRYIWFCTNVPLKVPFERKFREISNVSQFIINWCFVTKFGTHIWITSLKLCAKFQIDIQIQSGPVGRLNIYGNLTSRKIILVTPTPGMKTKILQRLPKPCCILYGLHKIQLAQTNFHSLCLKVTGIGASFHPRAIRIPTCCNQLQDHSILNIIKSVS